MKLDLDVFDQMRAQFHDATRQFLSALFPLPAPQPGHFLHGEFTNHAGTRSYKLYVPGGYRGQPLPLVVMLHGCTQDPDDFATGTRMNALAEEARCFVVYPAQSQEANPQRCWNWFSALDQQRGQGEPSIIAGIASQIMTRYAIKRNEVYVAGLSAGGAMAAIVGALYPDIFCAVGVHSGMPFASARDLPSALSAMKRGMQAEPIKGGGLPIIVFHGDQDNTVHPRNGEQVMVQKLHDHGVLDNAAVDTGSVPDGYRYTRTIHRRSNGKPLGEHWVVHGAGHAWSGGSADGSYTDARGPDASREMLRFFKTCAAP
jgi:poly(hydroxyalkanoate) depolymerase family esterase